MSFRSSPFAIPALAAAVLLNSSEPSFANRVAADACAAKLSPDAKAVYAATIGSVKPGVDLTAVVTAKTRDLVMAGKLSRGNARPPRRRRAPV